MGMFDKYNDSVMFNNPCPPGCENCCPLDIQLAFDPITNVLTLTYIYDSATVVRTVNLTDLQEPLTIGLSFDPVTNIITLAGTYNGAPFTSNVDTTHNHDLELTLDGTSIVLTGEHDGVQVQTSVDLSSIIGGNLSLSQVLINGNTSGANDIIFDLGQGILFNNGSRLREGTIDALLGGQKGIAQICAVGYELKWEAGRLYVMDGNGVYIRWSLYNFNITPTVTDDVSLGYLPGSRWTLDDGSVYLCTDSTLGAAVWTLQSVAIPTLDQVLSAGNSANNQAIGDLDTLAFNLATTNSVNEGQMIWNDVDGTVDLGFKGGNTILQIGQQTIVKVVNKTVPLITLLQLSYQAVKISGATGQRLTVKLAQADVDANSANTIGLVCEDIAVNQEGFVTTVGLIKNINTTGSLQGESWNDGDVLYLSPTVAGQITNIKPTAPDHLVIIGFVEYAHINNGKIYVKVDNGFELNELHDVSYPTTPVTGEVLSYITANNRWENKTLSSILGFTPVTNARTISTTSPLSGGGNLSANRTLSINQATSLANGYLSSTDWSTFNNKQDALSSGVNIKTVQSTSIVGSGDVTITDANLSTSDITTNNVSTLKHGFVPKASGVTTNYLRGDGSWADIPNPSGWSIISKSANQDVTNSAVLTDDTELQFSVVANGRYMCELDLVVSANNTTGDYQFAFAVSAGTIKGQGVAMCNTATALAQIVSVNATPTVTVTTTIPIGTIQADIDAIFYMKVTFAFFASANAIFKYQFSNVSAAAGRISRTCKGSILKYKRID